MALHDSKTSRRLDEVRLRRLRMAGGSGWLRHGRDARHRTTWRTDDIWLRREVTLPAGPTQNLQFYVYHDEDVEIYIDGVFAGGEAGYITSYQPLEINATARALLKPGAKITLAVHCHQTEGGQGIDVGIARVVQH